MGHKNKRVDTPLMRTPRRCASTADMDPDATLQEMAGVCGFGCMQHMTWALAVRLQTRCSCCGKPGHDDKGCVSNRDNPLKEEILRKLPPSVRATVMKMRQLPPSQVMEAMNKVRDARRAERDRLKTSNQDKDKGKTEDTRAAKMVELLCQGGGPQGAQVADMPFASVVEMKDVMNVLNGGAVPENGSQLASQGATTSGPHPLSRSASLAAHSGLRIHPGRENPASSMGQRGTGLPLSLPARQSSLPPSLPPSGTLP